MGRPPPNEKDGILYKRSIGKDETGWKKVHPNMGAEFSDAVIKLLDGISANIGDKKTDALVRRGLRKAQRPFNSKIKRLIKSKGLIDSGLMLRVGVRSVIPKKQDAGRPWVQTKIVGHFGFYSLFLEEGTKDRKTKPPEEANRGRISRPEHLALMSIAFRARYKQVIEQSSEDVINAIEQAVDRALKEQK